jgi:hypothetical protein
MPIYPAPLRLHPCLEEREQNRTLLVRCDGKYTVNQTCGTPCNVLLRQGCAAQGLGDSILKLADQDRPENCGIGSCQLPKFLVDELLMAACYLVQIRALAVALTFLTGVHLEDKD